MAAGAAAAGVVAGVAVTVVATGAAGVGVTGAGVADLAGKVMVGAGSGASAVATGVGSGAGVAAGCMSGSCTASVGAGNGTSACGKLDEAGGSVLGKVTVTDLLVAVGSASDRVNMTVSLTETAMTAIALRQSQKIGSELFLRGGSLS